MRKFSFCLVSLLWLVAHSWAGETALTEDRLHGQEMTVTTSDGMELHAWLTPSPAEHAPLLVLLPMMGRTHSSYNLFIEAVYERFNSPDSSDGEQTIPHILSLDLRGHGASTKLRSDSVSFRAMEPSDFKPYPSDVVLVIEQTLAEFGQKIDRGRVMIVGASIGANTAVMAAEMLSGVTRVVMLSPGESYRTLEPAASIVNFAGKVLIIAAAEDTYSKESSEKLAPLNTSTTTLKIYDGEYHGTSIIDTDERAMAEVVNWLFN